MAAATHRTIRPLAIAIGAMAAFAVIVALSWSRAPAAQHEEPLQWQYKLVSIPLFLEEQAGKRWEDVVIADVEERRKIHQAMEDEFNRLGRDGWDLYHVGDVFMVFKRPAL